MLVYQILELLFLGVLKDLFEVIGLLWIFEAYVNLVLNFFSGDHDVDFSALQFL